VPARVKKDGLRKWMLQKRIGEILERRPGKKTSHRRNSHHWGNENGNKTRLEEVILERTQPVSEGRGHGVPQSKGHVEV